MDTQIKFRGNRKDNNELVFGSLIRDKLSDRIVVFNDNPIILKLADFHVVLTETVVQFTGLVDKNGKEIYHKDRFKTNTCIIKREVVYKRGAFGYMSIGDDEMFISFAEHFANLKGKGNQLNAVEVVE